MQDKLECLVTHRQLLAGQCRWCDGYFANGQPAQPPSDAVKAHWNLTAIAEGLRSDDAEVRGMSASNLEDVETNLEQILPLWEIALSDSDRDIQLRSVYACIQLGQSLSPDDRAWLDDHFDRPGCELAARTILLGLYFGDASFRASRAGHIFWIIERYPESTIAGTPYACMHGFQDGAAYERARNLWIQQCDTHKSNARVLGNGAEFFLIHDARLAEKLLLEAQAVEPDNPQWHKKLAQLISLSANSSPLEARPQLARRALVELEMAEQLRTSHSGVATDEHSQFIDWLERISTLPDRAKAAFAAGELAVASRFAEELLELAGSNEIAEPLRRDGNAIHHGHSILGRVAVREGDMQKAKAHLLESGKTDGSPQLGSFGPNMSLAKDLLERGEVDVVLEFFQLCEKFWKMGAKRLAEWTAQASRGEVPEFHGNLIY